MTVEQPPRRDVWAAGDLYEPYVGRWSRRVARELLKWLEMPAGMDWDVEVRPIDIPTDFRDFDDYWSPFLGGQAPAPGYAMSLDEARRSARRDRIRSKLPMADDGAIHLIARAWAVRGRQP